MYSPGIDPGAWPAPSTAPYMLQMAGPTSQGLYPTVAAVMPMAGDGLVTGFRYDPEQIVMVASQYREVKPIVASPLLVGGNSRFYVEPADLPTGLHLDPGTGALWGTPVAPPEDSGVANTYRCYTVILTGPAGIASTHIGIKVVDFRPQNFKVSHVTQMERNKYMVLVETRKQH